MLCTPAKPVRLVHPLEHIKCVGQHQLKQLSLRLLVLGRIILSQRLHQHLVVFFLEGAQSDSLYKQILVDGLFLLRLSQRLAIRVHYRHAMLLQKTLRSLDGCVRFQSFPHQRKRMKDPVQRWLGAVFWEDLEIAAELAKHVEAHLAIGPPAAGILRIDVLQRAVELAHEVDQFARIYKVYQFADVFVLC